MSRAFPPGPPDSLFGFAHSDAVRRDAVAFAIGLHARYGDLVHFRFGPYSVYQLAHPDDIYEVLVRRAKFLRKPARIKQVFGRFNGGGLVIGDGPRWARHRRLVNPAFADGSFAGLAGEFSRLAGGEISALPRDEAFDIAKVFARMALRMSMLALFSHDPPPGELAAFTEAANDFSAYSADQLNRAFALPRWMPLWFHPRARRALNFLERRAADFVRERRKAAHPGDDLLGVLVASVGDDVHLRDEVMTMLLAGQESTAAAMSWACHLLAQNPEWQPRCADDPRVAECVVLESMRLYPPNYWISREAAAPVRVGGYDVAPGSLLFVCPFVTHRDARWFPDPDRFDPGRFEREPRPCAYVPFGAGPRGCVGKGLAMLQATTALQELTRRWRVESAEPGEPVKDWQLSLRPKGGLRVRVVRRE